MELVGLSTNEKCNEKIQRTTVARVNARGLQSVEERNQVRRGSFKVVVQIEDSADLRAVDLAKVPPTFFYPVIR